MRRRHAISPGFASLYRDLGIWSRKRHDSAYKLILSVVSGIGSTGAGRALSVILRQVRCPGMYSAVQ